MEENTGKVVQLTFLILIKIIDFWHNLIDLRSLKVLYTRRYFSDKDEPPPPLPLPHVPKYWYVWRWPHLAELSETRQIAVLLLDDIVAHSTA